MRHYVINGVLVIVVAIATYAGLIAIKLMPVEASAQSIPIDQLWNIEIAIICFLFALIMVPLVYSLIVFRRKKGDTSDGEHIEGNNTLEITWTVIPLIIVLILAYMGTYTLGDVLAVDPNALVINVTARQWSWSFTYPEGFTSKELHLPVNRQVVLDMESTDVIHSFFVPQFRMKQDILPGRITTYRVTPDLIGNLSGGVCAVVRRRAFVYDSAGHCVCAGGLRYLDSKPKLPRGRGGPNPGGTRPTIGVANTAASVVIPWMEAAPASLQRGRDYICRK